MELLVNYKRRIASRFLPLEGETALQELPESEEFIYSDPTTGQKTGIRSGQLVGPGTSQPGYYAGNWAGHQDHVHMEPAKGGGLGFGDGPDSGPVPVYVVNGNSIAAPLTSAMGSALPSSSTRMTAWPVGMPASVRCTTWRRVPSGSGTMVVAGP